MAKAYLKSHYKTALAILWFAFTFALVTWWWVYMLQKLGFGQPTAHKMLLWEGSVLLGALLIGGIALIVFTYRDQKRHERLRFFFSTFSHDIKTSIARLSLQAEVLEEDLEQAPNPVLKRLIQDIRRLDLQLENSLLLANVKEGVLLAEEISLSSLISLLRSEFADLAIELEKDAKIKGDERALLSVLRNLMQNSSLHGKATTIKIAVRESGANHLTLELCDNGLGFQGSTKKLGSDILISADSRGNGIGLLLTRRLLHKMNGDVRFESTGKEGFTAIITIPGGLR